MKYVNPFKQADNCASL